MFCPSTAGQVSCSATGVSGTPGCPLGCAVDAPEEVGEGDSGAGYVVDEDGDTSGDTTPEATSEGDVVPLVTGDELLLLPAASQATNDTVVAMAAKPARDRSEKSFLMTSPCRADWPGSLR